jgi:ribonuclease P protein component
MLSHRNRFHGHGSLRYVYRNGNVLRGKSFTIKYVHNQKRVHSRFVVVVSKKIYKSAVKRNRIRRRLYEVVRMQYEKIKPSHDVVITVLDPSIIKAEPSDINEQLLSLLEKDHLLR